MVVCNMYSPHDSSDDCYQQNLGVSHIQITAVSILSRGLWEWLVIPKGFVMPLIRIIFWWHNASFNIEVILRLILMPLLSILILITACAVWKMHPSFVSGARVLAYKWDVCWCVKCTVGADKIRFLGQFIGEHWLRVDLAKVKPFPNSGSL